MGRERLALCLQRNLCRWRLVVCVTGVAQVLAAALARAQTVDQSLWGVDPGVAITAAAVSGQTLYVGGSFHDVAPVVGGGAITDPVTGLLRGGSPRVAGVVLACIPDGHQGWFIGGAFTGVGGLPRANLAHIYGDGHVDAWAPNTNGEVRTLAISGQTLYVGGLFTTVAGEPRSGVAALNVYSGTPTAWNPDIPNVVNAILVSGSRVFIGGVFASVGDIPRHNLASVDASDGSPLPWDPNPDEDVFALAASGDTLLVGGRFFDIAGTQRPRLAAFKIGTGALLVSVR